MADKTYSHTWRIIESGHSSGAMNMAIDEALLATFIPEQSLPVLRIYGWSPPALSLGRFQNPSKEIRLDKCHRDGLCVVRRITGGGTIYHNHELTYSIVCSSDTIPSTSVKDSFRILTGFLIDFYHRLGLDASYAVDVSEYSGKLGTRTSFCFAGRETYDILVNGRKIGGNAQRRLKNIIFQHGSIPIISDVEIGLSYMDGCEPDEDLKVTSLEGCGVRESVGMLTGILVESFHNCFSVNLINDMLTPAEYGLSEQLSESKYLNDRWNIEGLE